MFSVQVYDGFKVSLIEPLRYSAIEPLLDYFVDK